MDVRRPLLDRSALLLVDGYRFAERRRRRPDEDATPTRLAGSPALVVRGPQAAEWFYTEPALRRSDAVPGVVSRPLFGPGAVHALDGRAHGSRKGWFVEVLDADLVRDLASRLERAWDDEVARWTGPVDVFARSSAVLARVALDWSGLHVDELELDRRRRDLVAMVDGFGSIGPRHVRASRARARTQAWVVEQVERTRRAGTKAPVLAAAADLRDEQGERVSPVTAATELLNLVRPQVAVAWLVSGGARALQRNPGVRQRAVDGSIGPFELAQEVRRTVPFVPLLAARPGRDTRWAGREVPEGTLVVLDVWGTDHDPRVRQDPDRFDPTRFRREALTAYDLVPQGGGNRETGHRCPGEDLTLAYLAVMLPPIARSGLVVEDSSTSLRRMPPQPRCRAVPAAAAG